MTPPALLMTSGNRARLYDAQRQRLNPRGKHFEIVERVFCQAFVQLTGFAASDMQAALQMTQQRARATRIQYLLTNPPGGKLRREVQQNLRSRTFARSAPVSNRRGKRVDQTALDPLLCNQKLANAPISLRSHESLRI